MVTIRQDTGPLHDAIDAERNRRIVEGSTFTVAGVGDVSLTGRLEDQLVYSTRLTVALGQQAAGVTQPTMLLRDGDNVNRLLTPTQMIALVGDAMLWVESVMSVSWSMKDGEAPFEGGVPPNWRDDEWWPQ